MTVYVAEAQIHVQKLVSVVKMATVLGEYITEEQSSLVRILWAKGFNAKDIRKEIFHVYGGKCLSRKAVYNWVEKFSQGCSKVAYDARPGAEVTETTVKRLLCCGFRSTGKPMGKVRECWWRICREINVFPCYNITCFTFYVHL
jgi:hypothetical protein